ncbi:kunitz-type protease inhibitor 1a [Cololabis saira]|uniref:kunitz-type protease inhibitor 1a n=1 Tax=Cololabis saira TaxID=129043 RepID=UPI002AD38DBA|nr:kunitz-type protease inhibitor 1a [Cololabis saira]
MDIFSERQTLLLLMVFIQSAAGQLAGEQCLGRFKKGKEDFVLDADESVVNGATFLSAPKLGGYRDCVTACCKDPRCNLAFMEKSPEDGSIQSCFLFDCLYKKKYACRFVRKKGYMNYVLEDVYENYLDLEAAPKESDTPPVADAGQDQVVQPHDSVTLNGIKSKDDNEIVSYKWDTVGEIPFAVIEETTFPDQIIVSNLTSGKYRFQLTVTDGIGQSDSTIITVMVLTPEQSEHHCMAPKKVGPCRGSFPRWHYNAASEKCEEFTFGGCRENLNNYLSITECTNACHGTDKTPGTGRGLPIPASQGEKCGVTCSDEQFTCANGCCLDPGLECDSTPQCSDGSDEQNCEDLNSKFRILLQIPIDEQKVRCTEPPDTGHCRDSYTKWYYDPLQQKCIPFNYGGCAGNENRFESENSCKKICNGVTEKDVFLRKEGFEKQLSNSKPAILAAAVILGVAIFILLAVLCYCFFKGKKSSQHQRVPVNNPQITTLEDRERLVYNSTTKPI